MTYKPDIRVVVDWDGDGYLAMDGIGEGAGVSPVSSPLSPSKWTKAHDETYTDDSVKEVLFNDKAGVLAVKAKFDTASAKTLELWQKSPFKVQNAFFPENLLKRDDSASHTDSSYEFPSAFTTRTEPEQSYLAGEIPSADVDDEEIIVDVVYTSETQTETDLDADLVDADTLTSVFKTATGTDSIYYDFEYPEGAERAVNYISITSSINRFPPTTGTLTNPYLQYSDDGVNYSYQCFLTGGYTSSYETITTTVDNKPDVHRYWRLNYPSWTAGTDSIKISEIAVKASIPIEKQIAQPITFDVDTTVSKISLWLRGNPSATLRVETTDGVNPTGTLVSANATKSASRGTSTFGWVEFEFDSSFLLEATNTYWLVVESTLSAIHDSTFYIGFDSGIGLGRVRDSNNDPEWTNLGGDLAYQVIAINANAGVFDGATMGYRTAPTAVSAQLGSVHVSSPYGYDLNLEADTRYIAQVWVKTTSDTGELVTVPELDVTVKFLNGGFGGVGTNIGVFEIYGSDADETLPSNEWIPIAIEFTSGKAGTYQIEFQYAGTLATSTGLNLIAGAMVYEANDWDLNYELYYVEPVSPVYNQRTLWTDEITASSENGANVANNLIAGGYWESTGNPDTSDEYLEIDSVTVGAFTMGKLRIDPTVNYATKAPTDFLVQYWNGSTWVTIHTEAGVSWASSAYKEFEIAGAGNYQLHRIVITGVMDGSSNVEIEAIYTYATNPDPAPTTWVAPRWYSDYLIKTEDDFHNVLEADTDYKVGVWLKADSAVTVDYSLRDYELDSYGLTEVTGTLALTTEYQLLEVTQDTAPSTNHAIVFSVKPQSDVDVTIKGASIYEATDSYTLVASESAFYDNLSEYILEVDWQLGTKDYYDNLAFEGTLVATVNNTSRLFSPANEASPLYGLLQQNRKVIAQVKDTVTNEWVTMWSGWTDSFQTDVGTSSTQKAKIKCMQGMFRLRKGAFSWLPTDTVSVVDVITDLVSYSGWRSTRAPITWWIHDNSLLGVDTYLVAYDAIWESTSDSLIKYDMVGDGWNNKTKLESALKDTLQAEDATLWVTRNGGLYLANRYDKLYYGDVTASINLDTLTKADYSYGTRLINSVEVFITPKEELENQIVWESKGRIYVPKKSTSSLYLLTFEYEEGGAKSVDNLQLTQSDMDIEVYKIPRVRRKQRGTEIVPYQVTNEKHLDKIKIKTKDDGQGKTYIYIENDNGYDAYVDVAIYGDVVKGGEGLSFLYEDGEAISQYEALHQETVKSDILTTEGHAKAIADLRLLRDAYPKGEFTSITIISKDATATQQILDLTIGDLVSLSESQTGESNLIHLVVGEKLVVKSGLLHMTYTLARVPQEQFIRFDGTATFDGLFNFAP